MFSQFIWSVKHHSAMRQSKYWSSVGQHSPFFWTWPHVSTVELKTCDVATCKYNWVEDNCDLVFKVLRASHEGKEEDKKCSIFCISII